MDIAAYLSEIRALAASGQATEHSYRPALERLFKSIDDKLTVINEPKGMADAGSCDVAVNGNRNSEFQFANISNKVRTFAIAL